MLRACGLRKNYGGIPIFEDVTLEIPDGCFVGLCGASGIGKSTLAKTLCGIVRPDAGQVSLDGHDLYAPGLRAYDRKRGLAVQMVYQQPYSALDPVQRVADGLAELVRYHGFARGKAHVEEVLRGLCAEVGLDRGTLNHFPHQISGGEAQRIALARCLLFHPRLLILDEATSMLDVSTQANVLGLVRRSVVDRGGSVLMISHDRELVRFVCRSTYVLEDRVVRLST